MESHFFLVLIIVLPFSCFVVTCSYGTFLESVVDIEVTGNCTVVKSGVSEYTVYGNSSKLVQLKCVVKSDTVEPKSVTLLKNGERIDDVKVHENVSPFDDIRVGNVGGIYTCRAMFEITNQSFNAQYYFEKDVKVVTVEQTYVIASDVGSKVYAGEQISISCNGFYESNDTFDKDDYSYRDNFVEITSIREHCPVVLKGNPCPTIEIPADHAPSRNVTCDLRPFSKILEESYEEQYKQSASTCSKSIYLELDVSPKLSVSLQPQDFDRLNKELKFVCTSDPPRLMYWTVLTTENVNMINIQNPLAFPANPNISITQKSGTSSIQIKIDRKGEIGDNGIQTVICSTYDTKAHVIKTAQRRAFNDHGSTSVAAGTVKVGTLSITLVTILSVVIVMLVLVVIFLFIRMKQNKVLLSQSPAGCNNDDDGDNDDDDTVLPEIVLHDNPTYLPYTDTDETRQKEGLFLQSPVGCKDGDDDGKGDDKAPNETVLQDNPVYQSYTGTDESSP